MTAVQTTTTTSQKSFMANWVLALLLGSLGIDRFYLGKIGTGVLKLITAGAFGIWTIIDVIVALVGKTKDKEGQLIQRPAQMAMPWIVTIAYFILQIIAGAVYASTVSAVAG